ncbi:MAG: calcineurin-like phosphoesterase C-terminal domain-containing protein [Alistipes sp.]|nr:calcineurin-like phosphoesterase C-terminal domain-containing protein [Alistipes sp.]
MKKLLLILLALTLSFSLSAQSTHTSTLKAKPAKGATIYGTVECDGRPLEGVAVSDGYTIVKTDKRGVYSIASQKRNGNVFITIPSGYEAPVTPGDIQPQYWAALTAEAQTPERHDFVLRKVNNDRHAIFAITDIHISNQLGDREQLETIVMPRIRSEVERYRQQGIPVYTMCMGDSSFDLFWYDFLFDIGDFRKEISKVGYPTPIFHAMGNHDNDGATEPNEDTDFNATAKYREVFGPTYYSFNIGKVHYIILDNLRYRNEKRPNMKPGKNMAGARNYDHIVVDEQLEWLKKDLAMIEDKSTPIVVGMHCPVFRLLEEHKSTKLYSYFHDSEGNRTLPPALYFAEHFKEFKTVHFLTGHSHKLYTTPCAVNTEYPQIAGITDHNVSAICGAWWFTAAHGGPHLAPDGAPAGFKVFNMDGKQIDWYYTSINDGAEHQFRSFDMNTVRDYYRTNGEMRVFLENNAKCQDFATVEDNRVAIHIWDWAPDWKVEVTENGKPLSVSHCPMQNPQYIVSYCIPKTVWRRNLKRDTYTLEDISAHMFHVVASAPDTTLEITVTDSFGRKYTETMVRPKAFSKNMK